MHHGCIQDGEVVNDAQDIYIYIYIVVYFILLKLFTSIIDDRYDCKITHNLVALDFCSFSGLTNYTSKKGHNYKLIKSSVCKSNAHQFSFACRRIDAWKDRKSVV